MSAPQTISAPVGITQLAIMAGSGSLPLQLAEACDAQGIKPFLVGYRGQSDPGIIEVYPHLWSRLGQAGSVIQALKKQGIRDIVMIGAMKRPAFYQLWPDVRTFLFFAKIGFRALGDNGLLSAVRQELEGEGFHLHGVHRFLPELLAPEACLTEARPQANDRETIALGVRESQRIGALDIGQSVIVQGGRVLGVEDKKGTNALIRRSPVSGDMPAFLVKTCKPQQDKDLDLPTIGPSTIEHCAQAGIKGIIVEAGASLVTERQKLVELANRYGIFVCGVNVRDYL